MKALLLNLVYYSCFAAMGAGVGFVVVKLGISAWPEGFLGSPMFGQDVGERQAFWFDAALYLGALAGVWVAWRLSRWYLRGLDGD